MIRGAITGYIDVAQLVLYAFFVFFSGLIFYLRREDRREGYPLESEAMGRIKDRGFLLIPTPKTFTRANGETISVPNFKGDTRPLNATKVEPWPGAPIEPTGNPMLAGVGPGSYAERADHVEFNHEGHALLAPLRVASNFAVAAEGVSPLGFTVIGADGVSGGVVKDLWVDRGEVVLRYYEVALAGGVGSVMLPVTFSKVDFKAKRIKVQAVLGSQFADVPALRNPDQITLLEEEKIVAYYGAGTLYATPQRADPLL
jgi:photosynthetic reaction center H subunit